MKDNNIFIIDVETTGPDYFKSHVLYVHIAPYKKRVKSLDVFIKYGNEELTWGSVAKRYFKVYKEDWELKAVDYKDAANFINKYFDSLANTDEVILCGHNVAFDAFFIKKLMNKAKLTLSKKVSHRMIDVHSLLALAYLKKKIPENALTSRGAADYFCINRDGRHSARNDVEVTKKTLKKILSLF